MAHNNLAYDAIILKNSMALFSVRRPRKQKHPWSALEKDPWFLVDSLYIMRSKLLFFDHLDPFGIQLIS